MGVEQNILTIGIAIEEGSTNSLVSLQTTPDKWPPASIVNETVAVTPSSTAEWVAQECLVKAGFNVTDPTYLEEGQDGVIDALEDGSAAYGALWAPNLYTFLEGEDDDTDNRSVLCTGTDLGVGVPVSIVVTKEWGEANPDVAAKVLTAWLRGIVFVQSEEMRNQPLSI